MPVSRAFLKPNSVNAPTQGDFEYIPEVYGYEDATLAGLVGQINLAINTLSTDLDNFYVVEDVQYQTAVLSLELGMNPASVSYSALVRVTRVHRV